MIKIFCDNCGCVCEYFCSMGSHAISLYNRTYSGDSETFACCESYTCIENVMKDIKQETGEDVMFSVEYGFEAKEDVTGRRKFKAGRIRFK